MPPSIYPPVRQASPADALPSESPFGNAGTSSVYPVRAGGLARCNASCVRRYLHQRSCTSMWGWRGLHKGQLSVWWVVRRWWVCVRHRHRHRHRRWYRHDTTQVRWVNEHVLFHGFSPRYLALRPFASSSFPSRPCMRYVRHVFASLPPPLGFLSSTLLTTLSKSLTSLFSHFLGLVSARAVSIVMRRVMYYSIPHAGRIFLRLC